jgi:hypothetical protein
MNKITFIIIFNRSNLRTDWGKKKLRLVGHQINYLYSNNISFFFMLI